MYKWFLVLAAGFLPCLAYAQQARFDLSYIEGEARYSYTWADWSRRNYHIEFAVPEDTLRASMADFTAYDNFEANSVVARRLEEEVRRKMPGVKMTITPMPDGIKYTATMERGKTDKAADDIRAMENTVRAQYLAERLYTFAKKDVLMPDHVKIAALYANKVQPLAQAMLTQVNRGGSARDMMNMALSFFQTIPYDTLRDRYTSSGAGFETPLRMLAENRGDCDSKSVAYLSLLRHYYPDLGLVMVYTPEHAFVGINIPQQGNDAAIEVDGLKYVLAEPVGPALVPLGEVSPESMAELKKGSYSWKFVP